jgi:hypothetical protein
MLVSVDESQILKWALRKRCKYVDRKVARSQVQSNELLGFLEAAKYVGYLSDS